jgi:hypothetical protein
MGRPLIGKKQIQQAMSDIGWGRVLKYKLEGAPIVKGGNPKDPYESDQALLEEWWEDRIKSKVGK